MQRNKLEHMKEVVAIFFDKKQKACGVQKIRLFSTTIAGNKNDLFDRNRTSTFLFQNR